MQSIEKMEFQLHHKPDIEKVKTKWLSVTLCADHHFFLSWSWIGTWLTTCVGEFYLAEVSVDNRSVGLGIIVDSGQKTWFGGKKFYLNRTGNNELDKIWIEYNQFLVNKDMARAVKKYLLKGLFDNLIDAGTLELGITNEEMVESENVNYLARDVWAGKSYAMHLPIKSPDNPKKWLASQLSKSSRKQINRSRNLYNQNGKVVFKQAESSAERLNFFNELKSLHIKQWNDQSGFNIAEFTHFHETLILNLGSEVQLYRLSCDGQTIAFLYNFVYRDVVYFYLSAINQEFKLVVGNQAHLKPGLVIHSYAIEAAIEKGVKVYDFLAGNNRYKETFANNVIEQKMYSISKRSLLTQVDQHLREIKSLFQK